MDIIKYNRKKFVERNQGVIDRIIRNRLSKTKRVVHGGRSQNVQLPKFLQRKTKDWDIIAKNPKKAAEGLEKVLDERFRGDFFSVKKGFTKRLKVHKVIRNITKEGIADFSLPDRKIQTISKREINWATLKDQKQKALANLKRKDTLFRREKDLNLLKRIQQFEKLRGKKI